MTPIFTPYLEIPVLPIYDFEPIYISANETILDKRYSDLSDEPEKIYFN